MSQQEVLFGLAVVVVCVLVLFIAAVETRKGGDGDE